MGWDRHEAKDILWVLVSARHLEDRAMMLLLAFPRCKRQIGKALQLALDELERIAQAAEESGECPPEPEPVEDDPECPPGTVPKGDGCREPRR